MRNTDPRQLRLFDAAGRPALACRSDALPEQTRYRDEGCELAPSCLNCPLPLCRYDLPGGLRRHRLRNRDEEIIRLRRSSRLTIEEIAHRFGLSRRSVFRVLQRTRTVRAESGRSQGIEEGFSPPHRLPHRHDANGKGRTALRVETLSLPPLSPLRNGPDVGNLQPKDMTNSQRGIR